MAVVLNPSYPQPRQSILLNRSPSVSPYQSPVSLPPLRPSSNASLSSSSSASPRTDSDYYSSGIPASPNYHSRSLRTGDPLKPQAGSTPNSRRIRFAPLPEVHRDGFGFDGEDAPLPSAMLDDAIDPRVNQNHSASAAGKPTSLKDQDAKPKVATPGSLLFSNGAALHAQATESTPTLASTATITGNNAGTSTPPSLEGSDWTTSPRPSSLNLPAEDAPSRTNSPRGSKWSTRKFLKPLLGPLAGRSTDDLRPSASTTSLNSTLAMPSSPGVEGCSIGLGSGKGSDKEKPKKKKREKGPEPEWVREFGMPLYRWSSEGDPLGVPLNKDGRPMTMTEIREAPAEYWKERELERQRLRSGSGTRLLNGRVYGAKRMNNHNRNPFANVRSQDPEFVEWGFGGMGSVQTGGVGAGIWAKVQAGSGVSIGAHDGEYAQPRGRSSASKPHDEDDDGSGLAWVKRRKERREREQKEKAAKEREEENANKTEAPREDHAAEVQTESSAMGESAPKTQIQHIESNGASDAHTTTEDAAIHSPSSLPAPPSPDEAHVVTKVSVAPPQVRHQYSHSHSSQGTIERMPSMVQVKKELERTDSAGTARGVPVVSGRDHVLLEHGPGEAEGRARNASVSSEASALSTSSSSEGADDADEEGELDGSGDDEDEDFQEHDGRQLKGAGIEVVSRHK